MTSNSWHLARTGKVPTPTPLQQQSIDKLALQQHQQQHGGRPGTSHSAVSQGGADLMQAAANIDASDWSGVPWSLTSLIQQLVARSSDQARQQLLLKQACEELKRVQADGATHASVAAMTVGTASLQRDFAAYRTAALAERAKDEARMAALEATVRAQSDQLALLTKRLSTAEASASVTSETLHSSITSVQADAAERGRLMARLGDRLVEEVEQVKISEGRIEGRMKELERRVKIFEISSQGGVFSPPMSARANSVSTVQQSGNLLTKPPIQQTPSSAAEQHSQSTLPPSTPSDALNSLNPFSRAGHIASRKMSALFVTHDSIQPSPPGTAVFLAAAKTAERENQQDEAEREEAQARLHEQEKNEHPLADVIEEYSKFKVVKEERERRGEPMLEQEPAVQLAKDKDKASRVHVSQPHNTASPSSDHSAGVWPDSASSVDGSQSMHSPLTIRTSHSRPYTPQANPSEGVQSPLVTYGHDSLPPRSEARAPSATNYHVPVHLPAESVPSPVEGTHDPAQFRRYLADYTTRNLQRDLLEIAETYQSTIRNEVDGLRGQLLAARRGHSEDMAKQVSSFDTFTKSLTAQQLETRRLFTAVELFVREKVSELIMRMNQVEKSSSQVDSLSLARCAQLESKYQQRNEEVLHALTSMQLRMDDAGKDKLPAEARTQPLEKDVMVLHINAEQSLRVQQEKNVMMQQEINYLKAALDKAQHGLTAQISSVHAQMKSLFADAFATVHHSILPSLQPNASGVHASSKAAGPAPERTRFLVQARPMSMEERSGGRRIGGSSIVQSEMGNSYKTVDHGERDPEIEHFAPQTGDVTQLTALPHDDHHPSEEKSSSTLTAMIHSRGYGTAQQVRLRHTPVSSLSRGHSGSNATTPNGDILLLNPDASSEMVRKVGQMKVQRKKRMEDVLEVGKSALQQRPNTSHGPLPSSLIRPSTSEGPQPSSQQRPPPSSQLDAQQQRDVVRQGSNVTFPRPPERPRTTQDGASSRIGGGAAGAVVTFSLDGQIVEIPTKASSRSESAQQSPRSGSAAEDAIAV